AVARAARRGPRDRRAVGDGERDDVAGVAARVGEGRRGAGEDREGEEVRMGEGFQVERGTPWRGPMDGVGVSDGDARRRTGGAGALDRGRLCLTDVVPATLPPSNATDLGHQGGVDVTQIER